MLHTGAALLLAAAAAVGTAALTGCGIATPATADAAGAPAGTHAFALHGSVHGGQQPISGSSIRMFTLGTSGDGAASTSLYSTPVLTGPDGSFSLSPGNMPLYSCNSATQVFLVATGGNPGLSTGNNPNIVLMSALGACSALTTSSFVQINELTTVAAVSAMGNFMPAPSSTNNSTNTATSVSSLAYDAGTLQQDAVVATELVSTASGTAPGNNVPSTQTVPVQLINTLGNILAGCVNSPGGTAADGSACGTLFDNARASDGTAPTDTVTALLNIVNHPTANTTNLLSVASSYAVFQPSYTTAPASYQVKLQPASTAPVSYTLLTEPASGFSQLYSLVNNAQSTIDLVVYTLKDTTMSGDLVAACNRGVKVRVILDTNQEMSVNTPAYNQINAAAPNCSAVWADTTFSVTHEKAFVVDGQTLALLTLNLNSSDYTQDRDFAMIYNDPADVAAMEATFANDYALSGGSSKSTYTPSPGNNLIWSPNSARSALTALINNAKVSIYAENEELSDSGIIAAFTAACKRGVKVYITMTDTGSYHTTYSNLEAAGCGVHVYPNRVAYIYVHAKVILADSNTAAQAGYLGSINFSTASLTQDRELGVYLTDPATFTSLYNTLSSDYAGASAY